MGKKFTTILSYGAIISLPMILMSVFAYVFDISSNKAFGWVSFLVFIITIFFIQRHYRDNYYDGFVSYGKMLGGTLLMLIVASIVMFLYSYIFYGFIAPEQITKMIDAARIGMYEQELSNSQINKSMEYMAKYVFTPISLSLMGLFTTFGQGLIVSLLTSIFTKKIRDGYSEAMKDIPETEE